MCVCECVCGGGGGGEMEIIYRVQSESGEHPPLTETIIYVW